MRQMIVDMGLLYRTWSVFQPNKNGKYHDIYYRYPRNGGLILFFAMIGSSIKDYDPGVIHWCFDSPESIRKRMYPDYKKNRPEKDPDYIRQMEVAKKLLMSTNSNVYEAAGYEADDLIYTLARQVDNDVVHVITGDKDLLYLCGERCSVSRIQSGEVVDMSTGEVRKATFKDHLILYDGGFQQEFGFPPSQMPDFKGLAGDAGDCIPGVPGVGEDKAKVLLRFWLNLEELYEADPEQILMIPGFGKQTVHNIEDNRDLAFLSRELGKLMEVNDVEKAGNIYHSYVYESMVDLLIKRSQQ